MAALAWWIAKALRYALMPDLSPITYLPLEFPIVLLVQGAVFNWTGLYKGVWRFASLPDLWNILRATVHRRDRDPAWPWSSTSAWMACRVRCCWSIRWCSRSCSALPRLGYRFWKDSRVDLFQSVAEQARADRRRRSRRRGARRATCVATAGYSVIGFVDDNPTLRGAGINGLPVLGTVDQLPELAREIAVQMLLIAMPGATTSQMRRVVDRSARAPACRSAPCRAWKMSSPVVRSFNEIKEVAIEDLLGRDAGGARLDGDPQQLDRPSRAGDRRRRLDRFGTVPAGRAPRCALADRGRAVRVQSLPDRRRS